jgi:hypothetical protein
VNRASSHGSSPGSREYRPARESTTRGHGWVTLKPQLVPSHVSVAFITGSQGAQRVPQFATALSRTHEPLQRWLPAGHIPAPQTPAAQVPALPPSGAPQRFPQLPQCAELVLVSTHIVPHVVVPEAHTHEPALQLIPSAHTRPQAPQCDESVCVLTHIFEQFVVGAAQMRVHAPLTHDCPAGHGRPHVPQFIASV